MTRCFNTATPSPIVCADTEANARAAAEKVKVDLEPLPEYMSAPAAMAGDAIEIHPGTPNVYFVQKIAKGDETGPIFDAADAVVEDDFYVGRQPHMPIEPDVGFAYTNEDGKLVIHSKSIGLHLHGGHDRPRPGRGPGKPGYGPEPHRRHVRVQIQPHHGRAWWAPPPWLPVAPASLNTITSNK